MSLEAGGVRTSAGVAVAQVPRDVFPHLGPKHRSGQELERAVGALVTSERSVMMFSNVTSSKIMMVRNKEATIHQEHPLGKGAV